ILAAVMTLLAACDGSGSPGAPSSRGWVWADLGGPDAAVPELVSNHETLIVVEDDLLLGTADGRWRRRLAGWTAWARAGLDGLAIHAVTTTADGGRVVAAGVDPNDPSAPTAWYSTSGGADWTTAAVWPRAPAGGPLPGQSFRIASL